MAADNDYAAAHPTSPYAYPPSMKNEQGHPLKGLPIKGVVKRKNTSPSGPHTQNPAAPRH